MHTVLSGVLGFGLEEFVAHSIEATDAQYLLELTLLVVVLDGIPREEGQHSAVSFPERAKPEHGVCRTNGVDEHCSCHRRFHDRKADRIADNHRHIP